MVPIGVTVAESAGDPLAGWATGPLIYAGSAQLVSVRLLDHGAAPAPTTGRGTRTTGVPG